MKKCIVALCSALAGVLSLVFLAMPAFTVDLATKTNLSGWELLTGDKIETYQLMVAKESITALTWYRIFAWIMVVLAVILIVVALLQILSNVGIIKMPESLTAIGNYALIALVVVSILALVANFGIRAEFVDIKGAEKELKKIFGMGASLWCVTIANLIAGVCANLFAKPKKKRK